MSKKVFYPLQALAVLLLTYTMKINGIELNIGSGSYCGNTYDLEDYSEVTIKYDGSQLYRKCEIKIEADSEYPRICLDPVSLDFYSNFYNCPSKVEIHSGYVLESLPDKVYSCSSNSDTSEYCTYLDSMTVIIKYEDSASARGADVRLRIYPKKSEFDFTDIADTAAIGVYVVVGIVVGAIVLLIVITVIVVCFCCKRRGASGTVYRNQQPVQQQPQGTYPQVQYQNVSPQTAGYQPPPQGYQPPPQGYQPPPQGYQPPPQGYQPPPQGYQPPQPQGYQPPGQTGYPVPMQGYAAPPPAQGFQTAETQKMPSAPPPEKDPMAPPPYPGS